MSTDLAVLGYNGIMRNVDKIDSDAFWNRVFRGSSDDCWSWLGATDKDGYGIFSTKIEKQSHTFRAHRVAFYLTHGRIPQPQALHGCDNPVCCNAVNLLHVHEGTASQNMHEMHARNRQPLHKEGGELNANAKLTQDEINAIRNLYSDGGITQYQLADMFHVSQASISHIVRGKNWLAKDS